MKRIITGSTLIASCLLGDVISVLPYAGDIKYDDDKTKSIKDTAKIYGVHASIGSLSYLVEVDYAKFTAKFKNTATGLDQSKATLPGTNTGTGTDTGTNTGTDTGTNTGTNTGTGTTPGTGTSSATSNNTATKDLDQDDITITFSKYFSNWMFKIGNHDISTNDPLLKDGNVIITAVGGYAFHGYDKFSYGLEGYYSKYSDGQDELNVRKAISITQYTPYFSFFKSFSINLKNNISVKYNYQQASDYVKDNYTSYEISDTVYYKSFFATLKYYDGKMRTGVKDGGYTVMNSLDLIKDGFDVKMGYYLSANSIITLSYGENNYQEFTAFPASLLEDGTNSVTVATLNYSF
jgi:hypothetical protein